MKPTTAKQTRPGRSLQRLVRWCWIKLTGEDPVVVSHMLTDMERLNGLHVAFLDQLGARHPKLEQEIREHRSQRFDILNPPNDQALRPAITETKK